MSSLLLALQEELFWQQPEKFFEYIWKDYGYKPISNQVKLFQSIKQGHRRIMIMSANGTGKTIALSTLSLYMTTVFANKTGHPVKILLIAGSWSQAHTMQEYVNHGLKSEYVKTQILGKPTKTNVNFKNGSWIKSATASEYQVFGKHVDCLFIDEAVMVPETIINDAFSRVIGSDIGLIILSSTPEPKFYFSKYVSMWERKDEYPDTEWLRLSWKAMDCPWVSPKDIEEAKRSLSEEEFQAKWLGKPSFVRSSNVFPIKDLDECIVDKVSYKKELATVGGFDFGFHNPAALVVVQKDGDIIWVIDAVEWKEMGWEKQKNNLKRYVSKYGIHILFCDSTRPELVQDLKKELNCQVIPVAFKTQKPSMQMNAGRLVLEKRLRIPREFQKLIQEMATYMTTTKSNDDLVDALMLALRQHYSVPTMWKFIKREIKESYQPVD